MKYFLFIGNKILIAFCTISLLVGCATYKTKYTSDILHIDSYKGNIERSIYLVGDAGNANQNESTIVLKALKSHLKNKSTKKDMVLFLGDNIYENGLPKKDHKDRKLAEHRINVQIEAVKDFNGKVLFIPGNHDWNSDGLNGLKRQENYIEKALKDKDAFQPEKGCPIEDIDISNNIKLVIIDSQWYLSNWDNHPKINDDCDIKTRNEFFLEIENILKKNGEKTIILAMHHPTITNGTHGGKFIFNNHLFPLDNNIPLPFFGSLIAQLRTVGGVSPQDRSNDRYNKFIKRLTTLTKGNEKVIFVSGHDHNLQYIENNGIKQIISGSGSKQSPTNLGNDGLFSSGEKGFARLDIYSNGTSKVSFYSANKDEILFDHVIYDSEKKYDVSNLNSTFESTKNVSVYDKENSIKSKRFNWLWGDHYRYVYGKEINVPVATLDTLYGGMNIIRTGGGHQTRSIRLENKEGRTYAMRAIKKSAVQFLQSVAFKNVYVEVDLKETYTEDLVLDFYTSSHPYATFAVSELSDAIGLYHTNPKMYFIPKHPYMGKYNKDYGNELYIIEERPDDTFLDMKSFGSPDAIESTNDVLENIRKDEKFKMDESTFIKARLFDMIIGDWDRHYDQWRWSRFDISNDKVIYRPIPRDRDQAFSNYDGAIFDVLKVLLPSTRQFQTFDEELKKVDWLNLAGIKIDRSFIQESSKDIWIEQANYIQQYLTDKAIDDAFEKFPVEVQDESLINIKHKLKKRRDDLVEIATKYYDYISKLVIITGTDKDDYIEVIRKHKSTVINISRIKDDKIQKPYKSRVVFSDETKEIWIYALDDDDQIEIKGDGLNPILLRVIGGQNNDSYNILDGRRVKIYDHKSKPNTLVNSGNARIKFQDIYTNNVYDYKKLTSNVNSFIPFIGSNPDDGLKLSLSNTYVVKGFKDLNFQHKHQFTGSYYFATQGFDLKYMGTFAQTFGLWNLKTGIHFASDNYAQNFFGFGNETENFEDDLNLDYNRVRKGILKGELGIEKNGYHGSTVNITVAVEKIDIEKTEDRFISTYFFNDPLFVDDLMYSNIDFSYSFSNYDLKVSPTRGMNFILNTGMKNKLDDFDRTHGYIKSKIEFYNALSKNRKLVLKTMAHGQFNLGDEFEFFQAANLGANTGLRGYRNERFSGKSSLVVGGDLRYGFNKFKTGFLPIQIGLYTGYDMGRVWVKNDTSDVWHDDFGGGLWINAIDTITGQLGIFSGDEGPRISFGFGLNF